MMVEFDGEPVVLVYETIEGESIERRYPSVEEITVSAGGSYRNPSYTLYIHETFRTDANTIPNVKQVFEPELVSQELDKITVE